MACMDWCDDYTNGTLATIESPEEQEFFARIIKEEFWLGMYESKHRKDKWSWASESKSSFRNW